MMHSTAAVSPVSALLVLAAAAAAAKAGAPAPRSRAEVEAVLAKAPRPAAGRKLHIVLLADKKDHGPGQHDYPRWQKRWAVLLGGKGAAGSTETQVNLHGPAPHHGQEETLAGAPGVEVSLAWQWPSRRQLEAADLIVMFCYRSGGKSRTWSDERLRQLEAYLSRGAGFVAIHSATYTLRDLSKPEQQKAARLTGLAYDRSIRVRHGHIALKITARRHPICRGLPETIHFHDEPYWPPRGNLSDVTVLATTDERVKKNSPDTAPQPLFWTSRHGKGRIFACVLGHFNWTFDDPYLRILLLRGMAWAAGESPYRFDPLVLRGASAVAP